eukprot:10941-Amphidinium_carterae.1
MPYMVTPIAHTSTCAAARIASHDEVCHSDKSQLLSLAQSAGLDLQGVVFLVNLWGPEDAGANFGAEPDETANTQTR